MVNREMAIAKIQADDRKFNRIMVLLDEEQQQEADYMYQEGISVDSILELIGSF